jgi:citrate lyase gamma subunit
MGFTTGISASAGMAGTVRVATSVEVGFGRVVKGVISSALTGRVVAGEAVGEPVGVGGALHAVIASRVKARIDRLIRWVIMSTSMITISYHFTSIDP